MSVNLIIESLEIRRELKRLDEWVIKNLGDNSGIELRDGEMKPVILAGTGVNRYTSTYYVQKVKELLNLSLTKLVQSYYSKAELVVTPSELKKNILKVQDIILGDKSARPFVDILSQTLIDVFGFPIPLAKASSESLEEIYKKSLGYNPTTPEKAK
jgi:hypothetical protein